MVYGIIQLINFAHGEVVMIGCMVAFSVIVALAPTGMPPLLVVTLGSLCAVPICMAVGYVVERVAYRPMRSVPRLAPLSSAIGVSIVLQHLALLVWRRNIIAFPQIIELKLYHLGGSASSAVISNVQLVIIAASVAMMAGLLALVHRTKIGIAMRPPSQNPHVARLIALDFTHVISLPFSLSPPLRPVAHSLLP